MTRLAAAHFAAVSVVLEEVEQPSEVRLRADARLSQNDTERAMRDDLSDASDRSMRRAAQGQHSRQQLAEPGSVAGGRRVIGHGDERGHGQQ